MYDILMAHDVIAGYVTVKSRQNNPPLRINLENGWHGGRESIPQFVNLSIKSALLSLMRVHCSRCRNVS